MSKLWWGLRIALVRLRFVGLMVAAALAVAYFDEIELRLERLFRPAKSPHVAAPKSEIEYFCPMHTFIVRAEPGNCPICGMPLVERKKGEKRPFPEGVFARVALTPYRVRLAGIETVAVERRPLEKTIETVGIIEIDERRLARLSARIAGRVERLHVDFTGRKVAKGDPVYDLYSPELFNTQREYILELEAIERARAANPSAPTSTATLAAARERLLLWGITKEQIAELERRRLLSPVLTIFSPIAGTVVEKNVHEGHYLAEGEDPYTVADLSLVWVVAKVYEDETSLVRLGQAVEIRSVAYPGRMFEGRVSFIAPIFEKDTRTLSVRVDVPNPQELLKPGMYVRAVLRAPIGPDGRPGAPDTEVVYRCCEACPEVEVAAPGPCPKCGMPLTPIEKPREAGAPHAQKGDYVCACAMHPEKIVRSKDPGNCPICGAEMKKEASPSAGPERGAHAGRAMEYFCPMHPQIVRDAPGECPICGGMALLPREKELAADRASPLAVPISAVIDTGSRKLVYKETSEGIFDAVEVVLGPRAGEFYPVISGLAAGERVVARGAFLIDAEARLDPGAAGAYFGASGGGSHPHEEGGR
jgi:RND family efflux transporter MFP subunit